MNEPSVLLRADGARIAYRKRAGAGPGVVWLGGFKSEMASTKATAFDRWAQAKDRAFLRFDYFGHGASSGNFRDGTVTRWRDDVLAALDALTEGPQILAGSSMGGFLALHAALARPERVAGLLLLAPATDFTEALFWNAILSPQARRDVLEAGEHLWPSIYDDEPYPITRGLIEDGREHLLLGGPIALRCPVRIVQGMADPDVPWQHAMRLLDALGSDVELTLLKSGDHRLSQPRELAAVLRVLDGLIETLS